MISSIFVNLPVADLDRAKNFYSALGAEIVQDFTDENASCVKWNDYIYIMVLTRDWFATFTDKEVVDPATHAQTLTALSLNSRDAVQSIKQKALSAGGTEHHPDQDYGFMIQSSVNDPDGNILEFVWMDPTGGDHNQS